MENQIYNDDVERIVNDPERQECIEAKENEKNEAINRFHNKRMRKRQERFMRNAIAFVFVAIVFAVLGFCSLLHIWISAVLFGVFAMIGVFNFGRFFENGKMVGWFV